MKHNVLLIQVDQMHAGCLSLLGSPNVKTPNLDQLAREGVLFRNATCQSPICLPSRVSMLSGQYPSTNRQFGFSGLCSRSTPWMHMVFREAGYATGAFGKFHVVSTPQERWGFERATPTLSEDEDLARPAGDHYRAYCEKHGIAWRTDQMHAHPFEDGDDMPVVPKAARPEMHKWEQMACQSDVAVEHSLETWTTNRCLEYLEEQAGGERPFFVWLSYDRPHLPTTLPEPWFSRIRPAEIALPPIPGAEEMATWARSMFELQVKHTSIHHLGERAFRFILATYFTLIEWIDSEVGRVRERLRSLGLDEKTTIVFTADHGDQAGWHGQYDKFFQVNSEAITKVPLIVRPAPMRGATAVGRQVQEPVELVDVFPTLCGLTGVKAPEGLEGRDLEEAILRGGALEAERAVVCEQYNRRMITRGGWKLVYYLDNDTEHGLFDLRVDPQGYRNVYYDPSLRPQRVVMKEALLRFLLPRVFGPTTEADVAWVKRSLEPKDPHLPLLLRPFEGVHWFGGAAVIFHRYRYLLLPMWESGYVGFDGNGKYRKADRSIELEPERVEGLLDLGISECMRHMAQLSPYETRRVTQKPVTLEEAEALASRLEACRG